jgi:hypothetical protein
MAPTKRNKSKIHAMNINFGRSTEGEKEGGRGLKGNVLRNWNSKLFTK